MELRRSGTLVVLCAFIALGSVSHTALAQDEGGEDLGGDDGASIGGDSELADEPLDEELNEEEAEEEGTEEGEEPEAPEPVEHERSETEPHPDDVRWTLNAGGSLAYGNTRAGTLTASTALILRRGADAFAAEASFYYSIAATPVTWGVANPMPSPRDYCAGMSPSARAPGFSDGDWTEIGVSLNWRLRWDHFVDEANGFFVAHRGRIDRFAGLKPRVSLQLGYSRMIFEEVHHHLALDLGVDATFDFFTDPIADQNRRTLATDGVLPTYTYVDRRFVPSIRLAVTYANQLNAFLTYDTVFEILWDVASVANVSNPGTHFRFEWVNHLRTQIDRTFHIQLDVTMRLDSLPPSQVVAWEERRSQQLTTMFEIFTTLSVGGTFDLDGGPPHRTSEP
jgi:hypothetical protein